MFISPGHTFQKCYIFGPKISLATSALAYTNPKTNKKVQKLKNFLLASLANIPSLGHIVKMVYVQGDGEGVNNINCMERNAALSSLAFLAVTPIEWSDRYARFF